ncbi:HIT domain-containing protein [Nonomuraea sp. NPDC049649]|uniref:HIT family protein n=1 Tax=Nonomuraea sp. NPDC049649 TaxID=3155776 RepID=UPI00343D911F
MTLERNVPFDVAAYEARVRSIPCFICAVVAGDPAFAYEQIFYEDEHHLAFLSRYPTMPGYALVSPKAHVEHVVREPHLDWHVAPLPPGTPYREQQFHALMSENGLIPWSREQAEELGGRLREAVSVL